MTLSQKILTASKPSRRSITATKRREKEKKEGRKKFPKIEKSFCACPSHNALKRDAGGKTGKLLCCKRIFDRIEGNLAEIQPTNHRNVQKTQFLQKVPGVNGLRWLPIVFCPRARWFGKSRDGASIQTPRQSRARDHLVKCRQTWRLNF